MSIENIETLLTNEGHPITIDNRTENTALTLNESIEEIKNTLNSQMNEQKQIIQSLIQTINEQQYYIEAKLEERDKHLIETKKMKK